MTMWKLFVRTMKVMGKRCTIYLIAILFMSSGFAMFSVMESILMKNIVDAAQTGDSKHMVSSIIGNIIGAVISLLIYRMAAIVYNVEAKRAYAVLAKQLFHHEVRLPYTYYEEHHSGDVLSKIAYDMDRTSAIYGSKFRRTVSPLIQVTVFVVPMLILSFQITLCLLGVNVLMLLINALMIKPMRNNARELSAVNVKLTEKLSNLLQGMEQARMYTAGKHTIEEFEEQNIFYEKKNNRKILYTAFLESCNNGFDLLCSLAFLMLGVYFIQSGYTTLGSLAAIYSLYGKFSSQFLMLGMYLPELIGCLANAQNVFEFMDEVEEPEAWYGEGGSEAGTRIAGSEAGKVRTEECKSARCEDGKIRIAVLKNAGAEGLEGVKNETNSRGDLDFEPPYISMKDITFHYNEDKPLLRDYNFSVEKGESVAVTGPSGCGKTTLSKLLLSLYPLIGGDIFFAEDSYRALTNKQIRSKIAYVPQEPYLFNYSVKENIRIGRTDASDEEIVEAAKMANAHEFILQLENGYDTSVGERGSRLSGGQKQRIAIARAILKNAPLLLMDEATSALDNESEQLVNDALKAMKNKKTVVMIAHRQSTIELADRIHSFE